MLKTTKFWLILSLCLNFLLIGAFVGGSMKMRRMGPIKGAPPNEVTAIFRTLPDDRREDIRGKLSEHQGPLKRPSIDELANLIDAEPFKSEAVRTYFDTNRARNDERVVAAQNALLVSLDEMSDEERDMMAEKLRNMPKRHHKDGRYGDKGAKKGKDYD